MESKIYLGRSSEKTVISNIEKFIKDSRDNQYGSVFPLSRSENGRESIYPISGGTSMRIRLDKQCSPPVVEILAFLEETKNSKKKFNEVLKDLGVNTIK